MSKYMIDKLLLDIDRGDESLADFKADPAGFIARWEEQAASPEPPHPAGGVLTEDERAAFEAVDYETLYAMGAHPYLLWHMVRAFFVPDLMTVEELHAAYVDAIGPHGYPDFAT